ncbi:MAG: hypothetical protein J0H74_22245 [Chitinophagaceae bacterium]|nr:hypothetical protein [Chitinophagaceae bacterium]
MKKRNIVGAIIALLVLLFVYTACSKLLDLETFRGNMYNQRLPHWTSMLLIWGLPPAEIAVAGCLLFSRTQRIGLYLSLTLLSIFTLYIAAILLHFFRSIPCSCGGVLRHMTWQQHFWFNLTFIFLTILALALDEKSPPLSNHAFIHHH